MTPTTNKAERLSYCEQTIAKGKQTFLEVGNALAEIMEEQLYKEKGYGSFSEYCEKEWGFKKSYAYQLVNAGAMVKQSPELSTIVENPAQARELAKIPAAKRAEVMAAAGEKPTAKAIAEAAKTILPQPAPSPALRGVDMSKVLPEPPEKPVVELSSTAKSCLEFIELSVENLRFISEQIASGTVDCKQLEEIREQNSKTNRWLAALAVEVCK